MINNEKFRMMKEKQIIGLFITVFQTVNIFKNTNNRNNEDLTGNKGQRKKDWPMSANVIILLFNNLIS